MSVCRIAPVILCAVLLAGGGCAPPEPDNPAGPVAPRDQAAIAVRVPLPKALAAVIHRMVARLESPDQQPVERELSVTPLGPATGVIGALLPGTDRVLVLEGYDVLGALIFEGRTEGITITAGDTARVEVVLRLVGPLAPAGSG